MIRHSLEAPDGLIHHPVVFDVGAGIRPMNWYKPARHICIEPHGPYADRLEAAGYEVRRVEAVDALRTETADGVYMLDVIEHMHADVGSECIALAQRFAKQIVVFTPFGFLAQSGDVWGLGGEEWQEHRSGWLPDDFPGWKITRRGKGFFALWNR